MAEQAKTQEAMEWGRFKATIHRYLSEYEKELLEKEIEMFGSFRDFILFLVRRHLGGISIRDIEYCGSLIMRIKEKIDTILPPVTTTYRGGRGGLESVMDDMLRQAIQDVVTRIKEQYAPPRARKLSEDELEKAITEYETKTTQETTSEG
jgi:hypothetical protein